ncbi:MAG: hypothetical protein JXQ87_15790 [Bacteroidia bacterium]
MKIYFAIFSLAVFFFSSCSSDSDTLAFEHGNMLKLKLKSETFNYNIEGNEVNEIGYFFARKKVEGFNKMLISGCKSSWDHAPIDFKVKFLYRGEGHFKTKDVLIEGLHSANSTENDLQIYFEFVDEKGKVWSTLPSATGKNNANAEVEILSIEPRYSPLNGSKKHKVNMNFSATFFNAKNRSKDISGFITAVVDPAF